MLISAVPKSKLVPMTIQKWFEVKGDRAMGAHNVHSTTTTRMERVEWKGLPLAQRLTKRKGGKERECGESEAHDDLWMSIKERTGKTSGRRGGREKRRRGSKEGTLNVEGEGKADGGNANRTEDVRTA